MFFLPGTKNAIQLSVLINRSVLTGREGGRGEGYSSELWMGGGGGGRERGVCHTVSKPSAHFRPKKCVHFI